MNNRVKTILGWLLILCLLAAPALAQEGAEDPDEGWAPSCIEGEPQYEYKDETLWITIAQVTQDDLSYVVADVQIKDLNRFKTCLSSGKKNGRNEALDSMAARTGAILAVNGDQYGSHKYGIIIRNGELIRAKRTTRHLLVVDKNGDFSIDSDRRGDDFSAIGKKLVSEGALQTFEFGPELVRDGVAVEEFPKEFDLINTKKSHKDPRTGIGQIGPMHYVIIVVDGRGDSEGISLQAFAKLFESYGAQTAINLDGGGSSQIWFMGETINDVSGNKDRKLSDMIYFG